MTVFSGEDWFTPANGHTSNKNSIDFDTSNLNAIANGPRVSPITLVDELTKVKYR